MQTQIDFTQAVHKVEHGGTQEHLDDNRPRFGKQCQQVYDHLLQNGLIDQDEADYLYGIKRLASRINDLKKILPSLGYRIETNMVKAGKTKIAQYQLKTTTE